MFCSIRDFRWSVKLRTDPLSSSVKRCFVRRYWKVQTPVKNKQTCVSIQHSPLAHLQWWLITGQPGVSVPKLTVHMSSIDGWKQLRYTTTRHCVRHQQQTQISNYPNKNPSQVWRTMWTIVIDRRTEDKCCWQNLTCPYVRGPRANVADRT